MIRWLITCSVILSSLTAFSREATESDYAQWTTNWGNLVPEGAYDFVPEDVTFDIMFDPTFKEKLDVAGKQLNQSLEGQRIELAGFMVPIETVGTDVSQFLLVPEAGQCVHVPPPPLNQTLVVDTSSQPTKLRDLYEPVIVSGRLSVGAQSFSMADSGYTLVDVVIEPLEGLDNAIPPGADGDR
ncbi:DUF3299 domain-containing protein [Litorivicinus sp.]|jgi:hypothetical protein|nr:DUF3299 domain-containing protein [Litorivicinus sp.]MDB9862608.1 DUF3299 domain-containing protein [Litorivicinus sp.]|tara:strand:- start:6630 stop:7181 length:552 start_codon:yes stop_codon:yes gene_type:complete|eukprot:GHVR01040893.1.p1 GENE.GHVR01040893.1~~GHVR01040893.1.p1  ORF type:complete len:184 (+),score=11.27 GHVR01040893.1:282-833(+)